MKKISAYKNNSSIIYFCIMAAVVIMAIVAMIDSRVVRMVADGGVALTVACGVIVKAAKARPSFCESVTARMNAEEGLECKAKDGDIYVKQGDVVLKAQVIDRPEKDSKRVHFSLDFVPNVINNIKPEGWALLASESNRYNNYTTVKFYGDHLSCQVETTVRNTREFLREYLFAYNKISETLQLLEKNTPYLEEKYPVNETKRRIGFVI